jgi:hypothetical protein
MRHDHVISVVSSSDEEEEAKEEDFRDDLRRQPRSRQAVLRKAAAPGDLDGFALVGDDHSAQFYVGIDPKLIYVKVEWKDREKASGTDKLVWDKWNCCWCVRYLDMRSSRASLFAGGFWVRMCPLRTRPNQRQIESTNLDVLRALRVGCHHFRARCATTAAPSFHPPHREQQIANHYSRSNR